MYMIEIKSLTKKFGSLTVFEDLNVKVQKGEVLVIIGPSGSGKSTFLRCLNHLENPDGGEVFIEGEMLNVKNKRHMRNTIEKVGSIHFWGLKAPLGALFCIWGSGAMLTSAPFDDWWHNAYGLDVKILSPPHALLAIGILSIQMGSLFSILSFQNSSPNPGFWKQIYIVSSAISVCIAYIFVIEFMSRSKMHHPLFYQVAGGVFPLMLLSASTAAKVKFPATKIALIYMIIFIAALWIFPLFPAEPKLSPVKTPTDHFVPLPFPLLLIIPALGLDLVRKKVDHLNKWIQAFTLAITFLICLFICQYNFSDFLISPASRNWFFATHEWAFYLDPNAPLRYSYLPFKGTSLDFIKGLSIVLILTTFSSWLAIKWGVWMQKIKR